MALPARSNFPGPTSITYDLPTIYVARGGTAGAVFCSHGVVLNANVGRVSFELLQWWRAEFLASRLELHGYLQPSNPE